MKFKISYFYHVRNFKPYQVPVSTAMYDPKWFHNNRGNGHVFVDKNGVINGVRNTLLVPGENCNDQCHGAQNCATTPDACLFLQRYSDQLHGIDFATMCEKMEEAVKYLLSKNPVYQGEEPECVLMVYETPDNLCSERGPLKKWFMENGVELLEFER